VSARVRLPEAARRWGGVAVSTLAIAAVVWWASRQDAPSFPSSPGHLADLALAVGLYAVVTVVRGWRWHELLRHLGAGHRQADAYALVAVGYMGNAVLPARGGEVLRTVLMARRSSAGKREVLGSIVSERVLDAASLALLFAVLSWTNIAGSPLGQSPALVAVGAVALAFAGAWGFLRLRRRGRFDALAARIRPFVRASRPLVKPVGLVLLLVSMVIWAIEGTIFWLVGASLGLHVSVVEGLFLVVLSAISALVPAAPGYVGTFDAALLFGLKSLGVAGGQAVAFVLLVRFVLFVPITLVGLVLLVLRYGGLGRLRLRSAAPAAAD
jgi:glycosyltransferase 2 family protein